MTPAQMTHARAVAAQHYREGWTCATCPWSSRTMYYRPDGGIERWRDCRLPDQRIAECPGVQAEEGR